MAFSDHTDQRSRPQQPRTADQARLPRGPAILVIGAFSLFSWAIVIAIAIAIKELL